MAERTVTVKLRALVDDYKRAMADAGKATDQVANQGDKWKALGQSTAAVGDSLTRNVTLPIVAVGAAALKMSSDFDNAFTRMQSLAGVSANEIDGLKESVLDLAGETGRAPQELAEALYFLRSSGLDGAAAMDALEQSAKASAAGLGNTATIADAVSSAMNAYAKSGLSAAEATDVLVATARAGKAEPEQLAASLGQVLPIASELGVTFEDVGGAIASLSLSGNDAARSSTLLTNVLSKLLKPSEQGAEALEAVGLSAEGIRQMIAERGLLGTLEELKARLGDAGFVKFLEDAQAVQGALALTGQNADKVRDVFDQVADSAGATESAFSTWAESMGSKNARAWADFQATLIRLGDTITPIAAQVAGAVSDIADAFDNLPGPLQSAIVYVGLFAAALGPILSVGGRTVSALGSLSTALDGAGASASRFALTAAKASILTAFAYSVGQLADSVDQLDRANLSKLENDLLDFGRGAQAGGELAALAGDDLDGLRYAFERVLDPSVASRAKTITNEIGTLGGVLGRGVGDDLDQARAKIDDLDRALASLAGRSPEAARAAFEAITAAMERQGFAASEVTGQFDNYDAAMAEADTATRTTGAEVDGLTGALEGASEAVQSYSDALRAQFDPLFAVTSANASLAEANQAVIDAVAEFGAQSPQAVAAHLAASEAAMRQQGALGDLAQAVRDGSVDVDAAVAKLNEWVAQGLITQESANQTALEFYGVRDAANSVPGSVPSDITTNAYSVRLSIEGVGQALNDVDGRTATVTVKQLFQSVGDLFGFAGGRAAGGPVSSGRLYEVAEGGAAELLQMGGRQYLIPGQDGQVTPLTGTMTAARQPVHVTVDHRNPADRGVVINGGVTVQTPDSPRQWLDELAWRLSG